MKLKKSKLLLAMGGALALSTIIPTVSVVSCSSNNPPSPPNNSNNQLSSNAPSLNIPNEVLNKNLNVFDMSHLDPNGNYTNKLSQSLASTKPTESKTKEEVSKIANEHLNMIDDISLQQMFLNSQLKGSRYGLVNEPVTKLLSMELKTFQDITNLSYNKEGKEISFVATYYTQEILKDQYNKELLKVLGKFDVSYKNLKIEASVEEVNQKLFPVIKFANQQPNASGAINTSFSSFISPDIPTNFVELINISIEGSKKMMNKLNGFKNFGIGENGEFTINSNSLEEYVYTSSVISYNEGYVPLSSFEGAPINAYPILFSKLDNNGSATWEVYNKKG